MIYFSWIWAGREPRGGLEAGREPREDWKGWEKDSGV